MTQAALSGRHALVCGASRGIGRAVAVELARRGARVSGLARDGAQLDALCAQLRAEGADEPHAVVADLDDRAELASRVDELLARRGPVHVLVNNTGGPAAGRLLDASDEALLAAFSRHLLAAHDLVRRVLPGMTAAGWGRVVNVVSISVREPLPNLGVSNVVRAAMAAWAKTLSMELPPGVTVNSVLPGYTDTERLRDLVARAAEREGRSAEDVRAAWAASVPEQRLGEAHEIAAAVAFLVSPEASYVRGVVLPVDGGRLKGI